MHESAFLCICPGIFLPEINAYTKALSKRLHTIIHTLSRPLSVSMGVIQVSPKDTVPRILMRVTNCLLQSRETDGRIVHESEICPDNLEFRHDQILRSIEMEIKNCCCQPLTLKAMSEKYYISSAYLGQLFHKKYGISFKNYLNRERIRKAAFLLATTDKFVYEICQEVGYQNIDYFITQFDTYIGCAPTQYRQKMKNNI